ncbi:hypothetical protein CBL_00957 [Carabus blaptoides fortunei]
MASAVVREVCDGNSRTCTKQYRNRSSMNSGNNIATLVDEQSKQYRNDCWREVAKTVETISQGLLARIQTSYEQLTQEPPFARIQILKLTTTAVQAGVWRAIYPACCFYRYHDDIPRVWPPESCAPKYPQRTHNT